MKIFILALLTFCSALCNAQKERPGSLRSVPNTAVSQEKKPEIIYWTNGKIKVDWETINDTLMLQRQYFESGSLDFTAEVIRIWSVDSMYLQNITTGEFVLEVSAGYQNRARGEYKEYEDLDGRDPKSTGKAHKPTVTGRVMESGMDGEWTRWEGNAATVRTYKHGALNGPYVEYYYLSADSSSVKWKGQFGLMMTDDGTTEYLRTGETIYMICCRRRRDGVWKYYGKVGVWEYYNKKGELLETVTYKWLGK